MVAKIVPKYNANLYPLTDEPLTLYLIDKVTKPKNKPVIHSYAEMK
jgi:hypothetical protein